MVALVALQCPAVVNRSETAGQTGNRSQKGSKSEADGRILGASVRSINMQGCNR